jgi:hypothetical protein
MRPMTREQIAERYAGGYGQGEGPEYRSWLQAHDVPSKGVTFRMNGRKTGRQHVLFSTIERDAFLASQWLDDVGDIREQFPLWPIEETEAIAEELAINHPAHPKGGVVLMTTDLLLTTRVGSVEAVAVKPSDKISERRVLEKLEIERLYWERRGVRWSIVTERELPRALASNLVWIDDYYEITPETIDPQQIARIEAYLFDRLLTAGNIPLNRVCAEADDRLGQQPGNCLGVVRHALARKRWLIPLNHKIDPDAPLDLPPRLAGVSDDRSSLAA